MQRPLRVLQVTPGYPPDRGGVEGHVEHLSRTLFGLGVSVEVATTGAGRVGTEGDIPVRRFSAWSPAGSYHASPGLFRFIRSQRQRFDLIHTHSYHSLTSLTAFLAAGAVPVVFTPHYHGVGHSGLREALHVPYGLAGRAMFRRTRAVIAVSDAERRLLEERFPGVEPRCRLIPNGLPDRFLDQRSEAERDSSLLLVVARLESYKRVDAVIEALALLPRRFRLRVVGRGPMERSLRELTSRLGLNERVAFVSGLSEAEMLRSYQEAGLLVSLSGHEAFGMTVLEAVACGCPVVASDLPSHAEIQQQTEGVRLVNPADGTRALAAAIEEQVGAVAGLRDSDAWRWDGIAAATLSVYRSVLGTEPGLPEVSDG